MRDLLQEKTDQSCRGAILAGLIPFFITVLKQGFLALTALAVITALSCAASAAEPVKDFIVQDIDYHGSEGAASLKIETNKHVDYVLYELQDPQRIIIDPLDPVWCDFEETAYFRKGAVKSIKFIKGREIPKGPAPPYYPFDFVSVELRKAYPYEFAEEETGFILNIGEERPEGLAPEKRHAGAPAGKKAGKEAKDLARMIEKENLMKEKERLEKARGELMAERERLKLAKEELARKKGAIEIVKEEMEKKKNAIEIAKEEMEKKKLFLKKEKARLEKRKEELKAKEAMTKAGIDDYRNAEFLQRSLRGVPDDPLPPDYLKKELTLDDCIQLAMSNSISVKVAKEKIKLAKLKINEAFRELFPEFSLFWDETKGRITDQLYRGRKFGLEFKQAIFHGGENVYAWEQAKINMEVAEEDLNKKKEDLILDVSKKYYELAKAVNKYNLQKKLLEDTNADYKVAKKEYDLGLVPQVDFMNIESLMNQSLHTLLLYENGLSLAKLELKKVLNLDMAAEINIKSELKEKKLDLNIDKCIDIALRFKPEYRISYLNTETAELTQKISKSQTFPQIDIFGKYLKAIERLEPVAVLRKALQNEKSVGATVSIPWGPHTFELQKKEVKFAPTVTTFGSDTQYTTDKYRLNLFDNMTRATGIKDASIGYRDALDKLNKAMQDLYYDIYEALYGFAESELKIKNAISDIELYNKELDIAKIKKELDEATFYELIETKIKLYGQKSGYIDALADYYIAIAKVNKAIGLGGFFS